MFYINQSKSKNYLKLKKSQQTLINDLEWAEVTAC
jgi:hypothetical protein